MRYGLLALTVLFLLVPALPAAAANPFEPPAPISPPGDYCVVVTGEPANPVEVYECPS